MINELKVKLDSSSVSFNEFYNFLNENELGEWDNVNSESIIKQFIEEKMQEGIRVSHILISIESNPSQYGLYDIWLGNSLITPEPINSKSDLLKALEIEVY